MMDKTQTSLHVGFILIDGLALMSFAAATEPFRAANLLASRPLYKTTNIAVDGISATTSSGARIPSDQRFDRHDPFDLIFVAAGGNPLAFDNRRTFAFLQRQAAHGVRLGGISGGPVILARAGLMAGRRMTVHWEHAPALSALDPNLLLERSLYVIDRDRVTCAGGTAPMDLMHALIAETHGATFARDVSDWFLHTDVRPSAGPQRAGLIERYGVTHPALVAAIEAMENSIANPLGLSDLARTTGVSERQLNRLFAAHLGRSTMEFYRTLRLDTARKLLTGSTLPITQIALATGFAGSAHFSRAVRAACGQTPREIRAARAS